MARIQTFLALPLLAACAGPVEAPAAEPAHETSPALELRVDASMPVEYQSAVVDAASKWSAHGFDAPVSIVETALANVLIGECPEKAAGCAWPFERVHFVPEQLAACNWTRVDGVTQCAAMPLEFMVAHELGHFLGLDHHLPDGNLMQPGVTHPMPAAAPSEADVAALQEALSTRP